MYVNKQCFHGWVSSSNGWITLCTLPCSSYLLTALSHVTSSCYHQPVSGFSLRLPLPFGSLGMRLQLVYLWAVHLESFCQAASVNLISFTGWATMVTFHRLYCCAAYVLRESEQHSLVVANLKLCQKSTWKSDHAECIVWLDAATDLSIPPWPAWLKLIELGFGSPCTRTHTVVYAICGSNASRVLLTLLLP